ncbi:manganese ion binding protein [Aureococcus anophagefferens]|nr:manganese ion binding protein [Aureococcus anophagefferens]
MADAKTKGADLGDRMFTMNPPELAEEVAEDDAGEPDPAHPARRWERLAKPVVCASRHLRRGEAPDGYAATPEQSTADFARCMLFGPVGLLNELASANHAVLGDVLASAWWPRACASLVRMTCFGLDDFMEDDYGDDDDDHPLGDVVGLTLSLLLMVAPRAPVRGAAPFESLRAALERDDAKLACSKCGAVFFCDNGNECQKLVWAAHRPGCAPPKQGDAAASHPSSW